MPEALDFTQSIFAILFSGLGVALVKLAEHWLTNRQDIKAEYHARMYKEADEIRDLLRQDNEKLEKKIEKLRNQINKLTEEKWNLMTKVQDAQFRIKEKELEIMLLKKELEIRNGPLDNRE